MLWGFGGAGGGRFLAWFFLELKLVCRCEIILFARTHSQTLEKGDATSGENEI